jgi:hypothetical protein
MNESDMIGTLMHRGIPEKMSLMLGDYYEFGRSLLAGKMPWNNIR